MTEYVDLSQESEIEQISDDDDYDDDIIEIRKETNELIDNDDSHHITKKLNDIQCPICFDEITRATATSCGHIFCLECIQQSISSSNARGQIRGKRGTGLCPLCRKKVTFKDTVVLRMKKLGKVEAPKLGEGGGDGGGDGGGGGDSAGNTH